MSKTITIQTVDGPQRIAAIVRGPLALHPKYLSVAWRSNRHWTITHVASGRVVMTVRGACAGRRALRALVHLGWGGSATAIARGINEIRRALQQNGFVVIDPSRKLRGVYAPPLAGEAGI